MSKPLRLSDLSPGRQELVRLCETINFGSIENLEVRDSEPVFDPAPLMLRDLKLDSDEGSRPELDLLDFVLSNEVLRLARHLDEMKIGTVRRVEVRGDCRGGFSWNKCCDAPQTWPTWPEDP